jgi:hypothetical protein
MMPHDVVLNSFIQCTFCVIRRAIYPYIILAANDFQLIGHGKKILLFDVATDSPIDRDEAITYINALVKWNSSRLAYMSTVKDDSGDFSLQKFCC